MKSSNSTAKPKWLKQTIPTGDRYKTLKKKLATLDLHTVCEEAKCSNRGECWGGGTATIIIMGDTCTRGCRFCAIKTGNPKGILDHDEPLRVAKAVVDLKLDYVVLTSVDRDDLPDGGAFHFAETIGQIKALNKDIKVEALIPDFSGNAEDLRIVVDAGAEVIAHNIEVTKRLTPFVRDKRADYDCSLNLLKTVKTFDSTTLTKSSIMVGLGETNEELKESMRDLRKCDVDILTIGQYLRPTAKHLPVKRYLDPDEFTMLENFGRSLGFKYVASGPMVRSSYRAGELFLRGILEKSNKQTG